ncbi:MAG: hypothetical protein IKC54_03595 [Clostridia bacterium]|nr:hypothetical protein [Clostridia bacterium]
MWSNVISIDKSYAKEIEFLLAEVKNIKDLSYAIEESKDRTWIYLASLCERSEYVEEKVTALVEVVILTYMKTRFFLDNLPPFVMTHPTCSLICSLVHFDRGYEANHLRRAIAETADFNVDGLCNFRLQEVMQNWSEVAELASRLVSSTERDTYDVASFITSTEGAKNRIAIDHGRVFNLTEGREVQILPVFEEYEYNLIMAIVGQNPKEIIVEHTNLSNEMMSTLKHVAGVVYRN